MCGGSSSSWFVPYSPKRYAPVAEIPQSPDRLKLEKLVVVYITECNLDCALCFTKHDVIGRGKTIKNALLYKFLNSFLNSVEANWIVWEGVGEVLTAPAFIDALNWCTDKHPFVRHTIITNGTNMNALNRINSPGKVRLSVSLDGLKEFHDKNRGAGNFDKTIEFIRLASKMEFTQITVRTIITKENINTLPEFRKILTAIDPSIKLYLQEFVKPQKSCDYENLYVHNEMLSLLANEKNGILTEVDFGPEGSKRFCVHPDGIYNCGNTICKIGDYNDKPSVLLQKFNESKLGCNKCPNNTCGYTVER